MKGLVPYEKRPGSSLAPVPPREDPEKPVCSLDVSPQHQPRGALVTLPAAVSGSPGRTALF